jgi:hypothetical protein
MHVLEPEWPFKTGLPMTPLYWYVWMNQNLRHFGPKYLHFYRVVIDQTNADMQVWYPLRKAYADALFEISPKTVKRPALYSTLNLGDTSLVCPDGAVYKLSKHFLDVLPSGILLTNHVSSMVFRSLADVYYNEQKIQPLQACQCGDDQLDVFVDEPQMKGINEFYESYGVYGIKFSCTPNICDSEFLGKKIGILPRGTLFGLVGEREIYFPFPTRPYRLKAMMMHPKDKLASEQAFMLDTAGVYGTDGVSDATKDWYLKVIVPALSAEIDLFCKLSSPRVELHGLSHSFRFPQ